MSDARHPRIDEEIQRFCDAMIRALVLGESIIAALNQGEWKEELLRRDMWLRQTGAEALERLQHRAPAMMFQTSRRARLVREVLNASRAFREKVGAPVMQSIVEKRATIDEASNRAVAEAAEAFKKSIERLCSLSKNGKDIE